MKVNRWMSTYIRKLRGVTHAGIISTPERLLSNSFVTAYSIASFPKNFARFRGEIIIHRRTICAKILRNVHLVRKNIEEIDGNVNYGLFSYPCPVN